VSPRPKQRQSETFRQLVERVRELHRKHGEPPVTMARLAKAASVSRGYWHMLLLGARTPSTAVVERIARALAVPEVMVQRAVTNTLANAIVEAQ